MKSQPVTNSYTITRLFRSVTDQTWTEELPIGVFLISHPNGPILYDTGESPLCNDPGFTPFWSVAKFLSHTTITPEDGVVSQLEKRGLRPQDLQAIVLSHLHGDHAGGLAAILEEAPDVPVFVSREHWDAYGKYPFYASLHGCNPQHWPKGFSPRILDFAGEPLGPWGSSNNITPDGSVVAVPTPGHVPGHVSLVVYGESLERVETTYFLVGDASYGIDVLDKEEPDGINDDPTTALQSLKLIKEFARREDVVVLPSHDPDTPGLLRDRVVYRPSPSSRSES